MTEPLVVESEATEVEVTFTPVADGTAVRIVQSGWDRLGEAGPPRGRMRTGHAWAAMETVSRRSSSRT